MAVAQPISISQRRILYGVNVAVAVVLAAILLTVATWAAGRVGGRVDLSSRGENSLSSRTIQLLRKLEQPITITGLYTTALKEIRPHAEKHKAYVADLLDLYESHARGKVTAALFDPAQKPAQVTELLKRLADKPVYKDEAAPHKAALEASAEMLQAIIELLQSEFNRVRELAQEDERFNRQREVGIIGRNLRSFLDQAQATQQDLTELQTAEVPRYGRAVEVLREFLTNVRAELQRDQEWMSGNGARLEDLTDAARQFLAGARDRYLKLLTEIDQQLAKTQDLKQVKLEQLYDELKGSGTVVVETPTEAEVLAYEDVWPFADRNAPPAPDGDERQFAGEQAVSSAILKLTQKEKTAVLFTRFGGRALLKPDFSQMNPMMMQQPPEAPYGRINELLEKENFVTAEWDVQAQEKPPEVENAARRVYVVFPPEPPPQPNPMQPARTPPMSPEQKQRIFDAVRDSGMALFVLGYRLPRSQFMFMPQPYEYGDYLKQTWGIEALATHLTVQFGPSRDHPELWVPANRPPTVVTTAAFRFTRHAIGQPLQAMPAGLVNAVPLRPLAGESRPAGVQIEPIIEVGANEDVWAFSDINRVQEDLRKKFGTHRYAEDIAAPFALGLAASNEQGQKLVVFGSDGFFSDDMLDARQLMAVSGGLALVQLYPGNADLFLNALNWLTGGVDRIAVGPRRGDVPRLEGLKEGSFADRFCKVFLVGIWPGLALLAGVGVALARRR